MNALTGNESVLMSIEHLANTAQDSKMRHYLTSFLAELCEEFEYCPICLDNFQTTLWDRQLVSACSCTEKVITYKY